MSEQGAVGLRGALQEWLRPPRPHGEVITDRRVSFLELFYDLVFVVFVSQVAHALAAHPDGVGVRNFIVMFTLLWYLWLNGTTYQELHGSDDGRSRLYMFVQMSFIALISVYAGHAADDSATGRWFSILTCGLILWLAYQWWVVRRQDTDPAVRGLTTPYFIGLAVILVCVAASAMVSDNDLRVLLWAVGAFGAIAAPALGLLRASSEVAGMFVISESLAERFGLFVIIVLGEVMVGVVDGLAEADPGLGTTAVGLLCLGIGFAIWWTYFDFVGLRRPRPGVGARSRYLMIQLVLSGAVAAVGAGMVSLIGHGSDDHAPSGAAWLIGGAVAVLSLALASLIRLMPQRPGAQGVPTALVATAVGALVLAAINPTPWALALGLVVMLSLPWTEAFIRHARLGQPFIESDRDGEH